MLQDVKNKQEEYAVPSWIRANLKIEENWDKFEHAQQLAEGGVDLVSEWSEVCGPTDIVPQV